MHRKPTDRQGRRGGLASINRGSTHPTIRFHVRVLFGWIYVGLSLVPSIVSRLITTKALHYLDLKMPDDSIVAPTQVWGNVTGNKEEHTIRAPFQGYIVKRNQNVILTGDYKAYNFRLRGGRSGKTENFVKIGNSLLALLMARFGGQLSKYVYTKNRQGNIGTETSADVDLE